MKYAFFALACAGVALAANSTNTTTPTPVVPVPVPVPVDVPVPVAVPLSPADVPVFSPDVPFGLLIQIPSFVCPISEDQEKAIIAAIVLLTGVSSTAINFECYTAATTAKKLAQVPPSFNGLNIAVAGTQAQLSALAQAIQAGLLESVGIPATATLTFFQNGAVVAPFPNVPLSIPFNSTIVFGPCTEGSCPTTGCSTGTPLANRHLRTVPSFFNIFCECKSCSDPLSIEPAGGYLIPSIMVPLVPSIVTTTTKKFQSQQAADFSRLMLYTQDCNGFPTQAQIAACSNAVAQAWACYVFNSGHFSRTVQNSVANGDWRYTIPGVAGGADSVQTLTPTVCSIKSSSSKKGLLGLLGLLGLIPLILCCCLLLLCCLRKRKAGPDVHFATFDAGAPAMIPSTGIPPAAPCYPSVVGMSPHAPSLVV